jgi:hypothetical protein
MYKLGVFYDVVLKFLCKKYVQFRVKNRYVYRNYVTGALLNVAAIFSILCCYGAILIM